MTIQLMVITAILSAGDISFERVKIAETPYEAASVFDINKDGHLDIATGEYWFPGPDYKTRHKICHVDPVSGYYDDFSDYPMDVDGDGYLDIVSGGWFGKTLTWRRNPKGKTTEWEVTEIANVGNIEKTCFWDIDGDGQIDIAPNTPNDPQRIFRIQRNEKANSFTIQQHKISNLKTGHGLGFGDINGDGRGDLLVYNGWFEAPSKPFEDEWTWHPDFTLFEGGSVPILVHDVNEDGLVDIICGAGHNYGLAWWEQGKNKTGKRTWTKHSIDTEQSQYHEMALADLNNDGNMELITGKRWHAHNGNDPGGNDPVGLYVYYIDKGEFKKQTLNFGPAESNSGTGIYLWIADLDGNGWKDIVAPGKEGLYVFKNQGN